MLAALNKLTLLLMALETALNYQISLHNRHTQRINQQCYPFGPYQHFFLLRGDLPLAQHLRTPFLFHCSIKNNTTINLLIIVEI